MMHLKGTVLLQDGTEKKIHVEAHDDELLLARFHEEIRETGWKSLTIEGRVGSLKSKTFARGSEVAIAR